MLEAALGNHAHGLAVVMPVHVDPTRNDGFSGAVNGPIGSRNVAFADACDPSTGSHHIAPLDHAGLVQGDDAGACDGDGTLRQVAGNIEAQVGDGSLSGAQVVGGVTGTAAELQSGIVAPAGKQPPLGREPFDREAPADARYRGNRVGGARGGNGRHEDVSPGHKGHPCRIGRGYRFPRHRQLDVFAPVRAGVGHRDEHAFGGEVDPTVVAVAGNGQRGAEAAEDAGHRGSPGVCRVVSFPGRSALASVHGEAHQIMPGVVGRRAAPRGRP